MKAPFKVGDKVRIVKEGSAESSQLLGQVVTIVKIWEHKSFPGKFAIVSDRSLGGLWSDEVVHASKLDMILK